MRQYHRPAPSWRCSVQLRVEANVDEISSRGQMAFRKDKVIRVLFEALVSGSGPAPKSDTPTPTT